MSIIAAAFVVAALNATAPCQSVSIGAGVTNISSFLRENRRIPNYVAGALVRSVQPNSPAARAGIQPGDVVQAIDGNLIQSACDFTTALSKRGCRDIRLSIRSGNETKSVTVRPVDASLDRVTSAGDQQACQADDGAACTRLAKAHDEAVDLLRLACNLGDAEGCYILGLKLKDDKEVASAYEQACDGGYSQACTNLGWMYENARGFNLDPGAAVRLYKRGCDGSACSAPNNLGCVNLGRMFRDGKGTEKNGLIATRLFRDVCRRSPVPGSDEDSATIARACSLAGTQLTFAEEAARNTTEGLLLLEKGCASYDTFGCYNLGAFYESSDRMRAVTYYQRACDRGDSEACDRIALLKK